jgi:hypothetical protein
MLNVVAPSTRPGSNLNRKQQGGWKKIDSDKRSSLVFPDWRQAKVLQFVWTGQDSIIKNWINDVIFRSWENDASFKRRTSQREELENDAWINRQEAEEEEFEFVEPMVFDLVSTL